MTIIRIGLDTSKHVFQVHGVDEAEQPVLRRQVRRSEMGKFFGKLAPTRIGIEACGASHHWARMLRGLGHAVVLMPPQYIKPYVKRGKNDAIDAAAICEAMSRPGMRFVPIKSAEQQAGLMVLKVRDLLVKKRTMLIKPLCNFDPTIYLYTLIVNLSLFYFFHLLYLFFSNINICTHTPLLQ